MKLSGSLEHHRQCQKTYKTVRHRVWQIRFAILNSMLSGLALIIVLTIDFLAVFKKANLMVSSPLNFQNAL